jgi:hypothetical protein
MKLAARIITLIAQAIKFIKQLQVGKIRFFQFLKVVKICVCSFFVYSPSSMTRFLILKL